MLQARNYITAVMNNATKKMLMHQSIMRKTTLLNVNHTKILKLGVYRGQYTDLVNEFSWYDHKSKKKLPVNFREKNLMKSKLHKIEISQ